MVSLELQTLQHIKKLENLQDIIFPLETNNYSNNEKKGIYLYKTNKILRDIATFMENPENQSFFNNYLENKKYFHHIFSALKMYQIITNFLNKTTTGIEYNAYHKIFILYTLINDPRYSYIIFKKQQNLNLLPEIEN